jgi:hypothetical protein
MKEDNKRLPRTKHSHFESSWSSQVITNSYVDLGNAWDTRGYYRKTIELRNTGSNSLDYQILGSIDGENYNTLITTDSLSASDYETIDINAFITTSYIPYIKTQVKSSTTDQHTTITAVAACM